MVDSSIQGTELNRKQKGCTSRRASVAPPTGLANLRGGRGGQWEGRCIDNILRIILVLARSLPLL